MTQIKKVKRPKLMKAVEEYGGIKELAEYMGVPYMRVYRATKGENTSYTTCEKLNLVHPEYTTEQYFKECRGNG